MSDSVAEHYMGEVEKRNKRIAELEAERDRLEERLDDWQRETALAKADRDRLRQAIQNTLDTGMDRYIREALKE